MEKTFLGILVLILAVVILALRNAQVVQLDLWFWQTETSVSLVILLALTLGALASFLLSVPYRINKGKQIREKNEKIEFLEKEIISLGKKVGDQTVEAKQESKLKDDIKSNGV